MKLRDRFKGEQGGIPGDVQARLDRGRKRMEESAPLANECFEFWRGNHYVSRTADGKLNQADTLDTLQGGNKPRHRVRTTRNLLIDVVAQEVSAATQRIPGYEVNPTTTDPEDIGAARLASKVAFYGYDQWHIDDASTKWVTHAVVTGEGFAWPYFDNQVGKPLNDEVATGEIKIRILGRNQVFWEPGCRFEDSPWHAIREARPIDRVQQLPGFIGEKLTADADTETITGGRDRPQQTNMVLVTEYLERPTVANPTGRRLVIANNRQIIPEEPYPCLDYEGNTVDEPVLHPLSYFVDPDSDRDMGLVEHTLDAIRTHNDCTNKQLEYKNHGLMPQMLAPKGALTGVRITDEPGAVFEYNPVGNQAPQWRPALAIPPELSQIKDEARQDLAQISAQNQIPGQVESGKGIQALIERDSQRRQEFIRRLAKAHARLMRHCLYLVARHYTEARLLQVKGRFGPERIADFRGAQLRGQVDVTVLPGSIEPRTRAAIEQRVLAYADRGWISPQAAMAAINGGTAEKLIEDYELDVAWQNHEIQQLMALAKTVLPEAGAEDYARAGLPDARPFDNHAVHLDVLHSWMKTADFATAPQAVQAAAMAHEEQHQALLADQQAKDAARQAAMAEQLGTENAARPQRAKPLPDQRLPEAA